MVRNRFSCARERDAPTDACEVDHGDLDADREEQQHDAELGDRLHVGDVPDEPEGVWPHGNARDKVSEERRQMQGARERPPGERGHNDEDDVYEQIRLSVHGSLRPERNAAPALRISLSVPAPAHRLGGVLRG